MSLYEFEDVLLTLEGHRRIAVQECLQEGELREAVHRAGEADGFRLARKLLADYKDDGWPDRTEDLNEAYANIAAALDHADAVVEADDESGDEDVGVW